LNSAARVPMMTASEPKATEALSKVFIHILVYLTTQASRRADGVS
jgi:hypothetical protein